MNSYLVKLKNKLQKNKVKNSTYTGIYKTWKEAYKNSSGEYGYANKKYDKRSLKKFSVNEKYTSGRNTIVPIILSTRESSQTVILDIGGGVNSVFSHLSDIQKESITCYVLERNEVSLKLNNKVPEQYACNLIYISNIDKISHKALDIAYFGSSIQYITEYKKLIQNIIRLHPEFIIFSESIFSHFSTDLWVLQQNMGVETFPNLFIPENDFITFMKDGGYKCNLNICIPAEHSHDQIDRAMYECKTIVFKKIQ